MYFSLFSVLYLKMQVVQDYVVQLLICHLMNFWSLVYPVISFDYHMFGVLKLLR